MVNAQCNADTAIFYLPQNEFNTGNGWYFAPASTEVQWTGGINFYDMYDPCVVKSNTVIISEVNQGAGARGAYIELTNVGDIAVDLTQYRLISQRNQYPTAKVSRMSHFNLTGTLEPGASYVIMAAQYNKNTAKTAMNRRDSIPTHNVLLENIAQFKVPDNTSASAYPNVVGRTYDVFDGVWRYNLTLAKVIGDSAEVIVDAFNLSYNEPGVATIAGLPSASSTNTIVRKQFTNGRTYGNTDFNISAGSEAAEASEWIVIPRYRSGTTHLPTTIGSHNITSTYTLSAKEGTGAVVNEATASISLPATAYSGDSIISYLNVGADMAWVYKTNGVIEDERSNLVHSGDSITFYHCGVDVTTKSYRIETIAKTGKTAMALSLKRPSDLARMYYETQGLDVDTIYGSRIYHDYPVDTLLKYIELPDSATAQIAWANQDDPRPTLVEGDMLHVTSQDGSITHDYYITLVPYENNLLSHDARLSCITWPDYPIDELDSYVWTTGDTIPGFNKDANTYILTLPAGTQRIPALQAVTNNPRATISTENASNIYGSETAQTTTFTVRAEDDSTISSYKVRFIVETEEVDYEGQPFFSEFSNNTGSSLNIEVCNPGNVLLDLSDYVVAVGRGGNKTLPLLLAWQTKAFDRNCHLYRPGYVYDSLNMSINQQYWFDPNGDANVNAYVEPGEVFTIATTKVSGGDPWGYVNKETGKWEDWGQNGITEGPNVTLHGGSGTLGWEYNKYAGSPYDLIGRSSGDASKENTFFLLRILNDSVKSGIKGAGDPNDYELIDVVGKVESSKTLGWLDPATGAPFYPIWSKGVLMRNPDIFKGNPVSLSSFGYEVITTPDIYDASSPVLGDVNAFEWTIQTDVAQQNYDLGRHLFTPVTIYKSTIKSEKYSVSLGFSMTEDIYGVTANTTASEFLANVIKMNEGQELELGTADGALLFDFDVVQEGDKLKVTSADKENISTYLIHIGELNSDVSLSSSVYTIDGATLKLTDIKTSIKEMVANLTVNEKSELYVVDKEGALLSLRAYDLRSAAYYDANVNGNMAIKVVAQNGAAKLYFVELPNTPSSAYITSKKYKIDQENKLINGVLSGINVETLLSNLIPNDGATMYVVNKWEQKKVFGIILFNDVIKVISADGTNTVYYGITLDTEVEPEVVLPTTQVAIVDPTNVYPNPTTGIVYFTEAFAKIKVFNMIGNELISNETVGTSIDLSTLSNGIYLIKTIDVDGISRTVKITKQ